MIITNRVGVRLTRRRGRGEYLYGGGHDFDVERQVWAGVAVGLDGNGDLGACDRDLFASEVDGRFAAVGLMNSCQNGMAYELIAMAVFVNGQVKPSITAVGVGQDTEAGAITRDISDKHHRRFVTDTSAIGLDTEVRAFVLAEGSADGPKVVGIGDMTGSSLM